MNPITLENKFYRVEINPENAGILQMVEKSSGLNLISDARVAEGYRMLIPLPDYECNYIVGNKQESPEIKRTGTKAEFYWAGPLVNERGFFDIDFRLHISLENEKVTIKCRSKNRTQYKLAEVWSGFIGGMDGIGKTQKIKKETEILIPTGNQPWTKKIFKDFGNTRGQTLGCLGPEHTFHYPGFLCMPWVSLYNTRLNKTLFFAALEETPRVKIIRLSLEPGSGEMRPYGNWPKPEEVNSYPAGIIMNWVYVPYTKPGEEFISGDITLQLHDGTWHESGKIYRKWFEKHFKTIKPFSTWIRRETSFYHQMFMLPEDNINYKFKDIPHLAEICAKYEVKHFMIAGWQIGGHDRGYPCYEPDPRLGTYNDLEKGIQACHKLGIKVSFFVNCQPVDMTTEIYRERLNKYVILDPHGVPYFICNSWGMGTLSARTKFMTGTPFVEMNPAHFEVRKMLIGYFKKLVETGADGLHFDKFFNTPMDFNPLLAWTGPDRALHEGMLQFLQELFAVCKKINPDFCISYEGSWDRLMTYSEVSWWGTEPDAMKAVFPNRALCNGIEQPYDFNKVNTAVVNGCNILIGPGNYNRNLDYPPMRKLMEYIREINRIRRNLFYLVSAGRILESSEGIFKKEKSLVKISGDFEKRSHCRWSLFESMKTGRKALILANLLPEPAVARKIEIKNVKSKELMVYRAFEKPIKMRYPAEIILEGERVAFVVEV